MAAAGLNGARNPLGKRARSSVTIRLGLAAFWAGLASCAVPAGSGQGATPTASHADRALAPATVEAVLLADRVQARRSADVLLNPAVRRALASEIGTALLRIREAVPAMEEIAARRGHAQGVLLLELEPALFDTVARLVGEGEPVPLRTGQERLDALTAELGLRAVTPFRHMRVVLVSFDGPLNVDAAAAAYAALDGVVSAAPDRMLGDGSDIGLSGSSGAWHFVFRRAWGDCPAGCMHQELSFFTVKDGDVHRVPPTVALDTVEFADIVRRRGW